MKKTTLIVALILCCSTTFAQIITTIAGTGPGSGYAGDHGPATAAKLNTPLRNTIDIYGNVFFSDRNNNVIRKIDPAGIITTIAGNGSAGYGGDGFAATAAMLNGPNNLALDRYGNIFITDENNNVIRKIDTSGIITTVAGNNTAGYNGDNIPATAAMLNRPTGIAFDSLWNMYIADAYNARVRMVNSSGIITTIAGTGVPGFSGDGGPATAAMVVGIVTLSMDHAGNLYGVDQSNYRVRKISGGIITTVAGNGSAAYSGDGVLATATGLFPSTTTSDNAGNLWICDAFNNRIRVVNSAGIISTIVGNGTAGYAGDGDVATAAELNIPSGVSFDICGNLYISDQANNVIRKVAYFTVMPPITGATTLGTGLSATLSIAIGGGTWSSSTPTIATIDSNTGTITGLTPGVDTVTYTNMCGTSTYIVTVHSSAGFQNATSGAGVFTVIPNPSDGEITVNGSRQGLTNSGSATIDIIDMTGRKVYSNVLPVNNGSINSRIILSNDIANGQYVVKIRNGNVCEIIRFSLNR